MEAFKDIQKRAIERHGGAKALQSKLAKPKGRAVLRRVSLGRRTGLAVQILDGLKAGEQVVLHPSDQVFEGRRIAPRD